VWNGVLFHSRLAGTYYEMGFRYGTTLYNHGFKLQKQPDEKLTFARGCETEVKRVFPEVLDEIHGFADACHVSYEHLAALIFSVGAFKPLTACSIFAASTASDVLFGRNYDFYYRFKEHSESFLTQPSNGYLSVGNTDTFVGRYDGVNEKGLAIGMTGVRPKEVKPGVNFPLLVRCVLDKCANVREAKRVLASAHHATTNNYLVADKGGDMTVIEACPNRVRVRKPEEKARFIVCTNQFIQADMQDLENQRERPPDSPLRYKAIYEKLRQINGRVTVEDAQKILSDHLGLVCSHIEEIQLGTLWSIIATLNKPSIYMAEGHPCRTKYKLDTRLRKSLQRRSKMSSKDAKIP